MVSLFIYLFIYRNLSVKLDSFPEEIVASQLGSLLLSRIVLLDPTAQNFLLPQVFNPRRGKFAVLTLTIWYKWTYKLF